MWELLPDFAVRAPTLADAPAVYELMIACDLDEHGEADIDLHTLEADWQQAGFDLARDAWLVFASAGTLVGFADVHITADDCDAWADGYVHPAWRDRGIGGALLALCEARARELIAVLPPERAATISAGHAAVNTAARDLLTAAGMRPIRHFWRMAIALDAPPPAPLVPAGIALRAFVRTQDSRAVYETIEEAFEDHWGHVRPPYEEWERARMGHDDFDPGLWFVAQAGDQSAGAVLAEYRAGRPYVRYLGVRRPWRDRGLGRALLLQAFAAFYARGERRVELAVDSQNSTGATHLYESVGMTVTREFVVYDRRLRDGEPCA